MNELSKETFVLCLKGGLRIPITKERRDFIASALADKSIDTLDIDDKLIARYSILYVLPMKDIEIVERKERGEWQCDKGHWNDKGSKRCEGEGKHCYY